MVAIVGRALRLAATLLALASIPSTARAQAAPTTTNAGYVERVYPDPPSTERIKTLVWYPSSTAAKDSGQDPYRIFAQPGGVPIPGRRPLIVVSHGSFGYVFSLHHVAEYFAERGYIVATVIHPRDNNADSSGFGADVSLLGRSRHVARLIDGLLADPAIGPRIDPRRIGLVGFSAGGITALTLAGAAPDFSRITSYCAENADDGSTCRGGLNGTVRIENPALRITPDSRVRAAVLLAPAWGFMFPRETLAKVTMPLLIFRGANDNDVREPFSAEWIGRNVATPSPPIVVPGPHLVFLAPCKPGVSADMCADAPGFDRRPVHERILSESLRFFQRTLR